MKRKLSEYYYEDFWSMPDYLIETINIQVVFFFSSCLLFFYKTRLNMFSNQMSGGC